MGGSRLRVGLLRASCSFQVSSANSPKRTYDRFIPASRHSLSAHQPSAVGHEDQFPPTRLSGCCGFRKRSFAVDD